MLKLIFFFKSEKVKAGLLIWDGGSSWYEKEEKARATIGGNIYFKCANKACNIHHNATVIIDKYHLITESYTICMFNMVQKLRTKSSINWKGMIWIFKRVCE